MESHESDLRAEVQDDEMVRRIQDDYRGASLDSATLGLLDFAVKLTLSPRDMIRADVDQLRRLGFDDTTILEAVQTISYFNYANRVMDSLGIEPEPDMRYGQRT